MSSPTSSLALSLSSPPTNAASGSLTTATAAASTTISNALFFLVPLFSFALVVLALSHRPVQRTHAGSRPQARIAYAFIALLAVLSTLAGALPLSLSHTGTPRAEAVVQALLSFLLGIPALHLATHYDTAGTRTRNAVLHSSVLVITLSGATLTALVLKQQPSSSAPAAAAVTAGPWACPLYLPPALFLLYSLLALHRIARSLLHFLYPTSSASVASSSPVRFPFCFPSSTLQRSTRRRPITIHISTQRTSVPLSLPSPASSAASFGCTDLDIGRSQQYQAQPIDLALELELALPKRKDSRSHLDNNDDQYPVLYRHGKSESVDSTTSTVTAVDHHPQLHQRQDSAAASNTDTDTPTPNTPTTATAQSHTNTHTHHHASSSQESPLPLIELATPPRAAYTRTSAVTFDPDAQVFSSSPRTREREREREEEHTYSFESPSLSGEDTSGIIVNPEDKDEDDEDDLNDTNANANASLRAQLTYSRSRSLLVFLLAAQLTLIVGYGCELGEGINISLLSSNSNSDSSGGAPLGIIQAACTVLAVTGTMAAYLLHAYNTHLSPSRSRTPAKSKSKSKSDTASAPFAYNHSQSHHYNNNNNNNNIPSVSTYPPPPLSNTSSNNGGYPNPSSVIQIAERNTRPVLIQLAPPPPPRTRRRRVDAFAMGGVAGLGPVPVPVPVHGGREREGMRMRMDAPRSVSGTGPSVGTSVRRSNEVEGQEGEGDALDELDMYSYVHSNSYPTATATATTQTYRYSPPDVRYQHYDGGGAPRYEYERNTDDNISGYNGRRRSMAREPITLTYEPPVVSGGLSMLDTTETEGEVEGEGGEVHDSDYEDVMDDDYDYDEGGAMGMGMEDMDGDLDLEDEMQKALSRSSSMATTMSGLSVAKTKARRRVSLRRGVVGGGGGGGGMLNSSGKPLKSAPAAVSVKPKSKPKSKAKKAMEDPATYIRKRGSVPAVSPVRKLFGWELAWDPLPLPAGAAAGGRGRRGSVGGVGKKSRGTDRSFSFGSVSGNGNGGEKEKGREREVERAQESSFMDMKGSQRDAGVAVGVVPTTMKKLKRHSTPAGSMYARSVVGGAVGGGGRRQEKWEDVCGVVVTSANLQPTVARESAENAGGRKLKKKRSQSATRGHGIADGAVSPSKAKAFIPVPMPVPVSVSVPSSNLGAGLPHHAYNGSYSSNETAPTKEYYNDIGKQHRTVKSGSSSSGTNTISRPDTADSAKGSMRRGLQLKRSFKMSVGRTLGPGLTLASADVVNSNEREDRVEKGRVIERERERCSDEGVGDEDEDLDADVDVDGEMRSLAAARLVSASIARATPAATIVTAPSASLTTPPPSAFPIKAKSSPVNITYPSLSSNAVAARPALPAIVTSPIPIPTASAIPFPLSAPATRRPPTGFSPVVPTPTSARQPHTSGSTWKPHPFADPVQPPPMPKSGAPIHMTAGSEGAAVSVEDDVVQLEREMEEIRGRRGDGNDSPTAQFRELTDAMADQAAPVSVSASPAMSTSMTPSLKSMFALAHAQAQNVGPPPPAVSAASSEKEKEKARSKLFGGGHLQKRIALSSPPPVAKSDWAPQSSVGNGGMSGGGFLYRFPMIFPNSFTGSPPRSNPLVNGQSQAAVPRPSTPRGGSTLRLSAMGSVRSAFAGVGARMSSATSRMSVNSSAGVSLRSGGGHGFGQMIMEDIDGDFMDLRDPFASPPPASNIATVPPPALTPSKKKSSKSRGGGRDRDGASAMMGEGVRYGVEDVEFPEMLTRKMSTWGKLPMPIRSFSPAPSATSGNVSTTVGVKRHSFVNGRAVVRIVGKPSSSHRKHKKERRARKATLSSMSNVMGSNMKAGAEDADFGLEEALLSQRLLNRLDSDGWESRV